jgi:hypothetical protein
LTPRVRDPVSRLLGVNMDIVAGEIENFRARDGAGAILTTSYALNAWLRFYGKGDIPVVQLNERYRYLNEPPPPDSLFAGPLLYVSLARNEEYALLSRRFARVTKLGPVTRTRNGAIIDEYVVYAVEGPTGPPLDQGR